MSTGYKLSSRPLVSCIVVNYNGKSVLGQCLKSLTGQTYRPLEIIVVDNGSSDGSSEYVQTMFPEVRLIRSDVNLGFARGNNLGVMSAMGDFVALFNNDIIAEEQCIDELVRAILSDPLVAIASAKGRNLNLPHAYQEHIPSVNPLGQLVLLQDSNPAEVFSPAGCAFMFRRSLVGIPFDEEYFAYGEDVYLAWKMRLQGYKIAYVPSARVVHIGSWTSMHLIQDQALSRYLDHLKHRNKFLNLIIFYEFTNLLKLIPLLPFAFLLGSGRRHGVRALLSLCARPRTVIRKRREIQRLRRTPDTEITCHMSSLWDHRLLSQDLRNRLFRAYCRFVGLSTLE